MKTCKGLIIEGIPGTGKTSLLEKLRQDNIGQKLKCSSEFIFSEEITQRVLEKQFNDGKLDKTNNIKLLEDIISPLENYQLKLLNRGWSHLQFYYILERFHLTHVSYYSYLGWEDVEDIDNRLYNLGSKVCLLTMKDKVFSDRLINRRGEPWRKYLSRYGKTEKEIIKHYINQQKDLIELTRKTKLPLLMIDTTYMSLEEIYKKIINFFIE
jgi:adenylate kinase family enzyme